MDQLPNTRYQSNQGFDLSKEADLKKLQMNMAALSDPAIQTKLIALFGIDNPQEMMIFLKSPAGKKTLAEIAKEIALAEKYEQNIAEQQQDTATRRRMLLAFLFFIGLERSEARSDHLNRLIAEQYHQLVEKRYNEKAYSTQGTISQVVDSYIESFNHIIQAQAKLNLEFKTIAHEQKALDSRYDDYFKALSSLESDFGKDINTFNEQSLEKQIELLTEDLNKQTQLITQKLDEDKEDEAKTLLQKQNADNLKIAGLKDLLAVKVGRKALWDSEGNPTNTYKDAAFIVDAKTAETKKIINVDGEPLLVNKNANAEAVRNDPNLRQEARQQFQHLKRDIVPLKQLVDQNKQAEQTLLDHRLETAKTEQSKLDQDGKELMNYINKIHSAEASLANTPQPDAPAPKPSSSAPSSELNPKLQAVVAQHVIQRIEPLQFRPVTQSDKFDLRAIFKNLANNPALRELPLVKQELTTIVVGQPIPKENFARYLQQLNNYVNASYRSDLGPDYFKGPNENKQPQSPANWPPTPNPYR